ncbi:hypothetical protein PIB30_087086 [Stylosanthes scabra]|uniref:Uncharacterized protein n=1 Tax=Stylosanthes scabra TaxID=79078 RepID=A0ABU6STL8_9FABA|nr:hypothetical protein [Stylosanthes scabra]
MRLPRKSSKLPIQGISHVWAMSKLDHLRTKASQGISPRSHACHVWPMSLTWPKRDPSQGKLTLIMPQHPQNLKPSPHFKLPSLIHVFGEQKRDQSPQHIKATFESRLAKPKRDPNVRKSTHPKLSPLSTQGHVWTKFQTWPKRDFPLSKAMICRSSPNSAKGSLESRANREQDSALMTRCHNPRLGVA